MRIYRQNWLIFETQFRLWIRGPCGYFWWENPEIKNLVQVYLYSMSVKTEVAGVKVLLNSLWKEVQYPDKKKRQYEKSQICFYLFKWHWHKIFCLRAFCRQAATMKPQPMKFPEFLSYSKDSSSVDLNLLIHLSVLYPKLTQGVLCLDGTFTVEGLSYILTGILSPPNFLPTKFFRPHDIPSPMSTVLGFYFQSRLALKRKFLFSFFRKKLSQLFAKNAYEMLCLRENFTSS